LFFLGLIRVGIGWDVVLNVTGDRAVFGVFFGELIVGKGCFVVQLIV
jgi:hypothetical protein